MIKAFLVAFILTLVVLIALDWHPAEGAEATCADDYYALIGSLEGMRANHAAWVDYLRWAGPSYQAPADVGSIAVQLEKVAIYDRREWATYAIASGDRSAADALLADYYDALSQHRWWFDQSSRGVGISPPSFHLQVIAEYEWRIATTQRLMWEC